LRDEEVAERVTVQNLLNHTADWSGDLMEDTGRDVPACGADGRPGGGRA
jgi:hypothetical protein